MTDRCDGLSTSRRNDYLPAETTCEPSAEQAAAKDAFAQQATEREAAARRDAYFATGTDEGGRSSRASSDPGALQTASHHDRHDLDVQVEAYTARFDHPLPDDAAGNAIIAAIGAAAVGGVRTAGGGVDVAGAAIVKAVVESAAKSLVRAIRNESLGLVYDASRLGAALPSSVVDPAAPAGPAASGGPAAPAPKTQVEGPAVGRSSPLGASEIVRTPVRTEAPRIPELLPPLPFRTQG
jgi:hypothetical protein